MHNPDVERMIDIDILLSQVIKASTRTVNDRPYLMQLLRVYCDSVANDVPDFESKKGSIALFMRELIEDCSEDVARDILEQL